MQLQVIKTAVVLGTVMFDLFTIQNGRRGGFDISAYIPLNRSCDHGTAQVTLGVLTELVVKRHGNAKSQSLWFSFVYHACGHEFEARLK